VCVTLPKLSKLSFLRKKINFAITLEDAVACTEKKILIPQIFRDTSDVYNLSRP